MKTLHSKAAGYQEHVKEIEERKYSVKVIKTVVFGLADGLLVMFSFVAGLSGAFGEGGRTLIVLSAIIALIVEALIMGVVQYLSDKTEKEVIEAWAAQEMSAIDEIPDIERQELVEIYRQQGFSDSTIEVMMGEIVANKQLWMKKMLLEELGLHLEKLRPAYKDAIIMAATTAVGGIIPVIPLILGVTHTLYVMIVVTSATLFALGGAKSYFSRVKWYKSALQMMLLGLAAAMACYAIGVGLQQIVLT